MFYIIQVFFQIVLDYPHQPTHMSDVTINRT